MNQDELQNTVLCGDALEMLKRLPDEYVQMCVTSPPYYGLRDYGAEGQIGCEQTPLEYIDRLTEIFREVRRVLKSNGTLWLNIADSYAGSGNGGNVRPCRKIAAYGERRPARIHHGKGHRSCCAQNSQKA